MSRRSSSGVSAAVRVALDTLHEALRATHDPDSPVLGTDVLGVVAAGFALSALGFVLAAIAEGAGAAGIVCAVACASGCVVTVRVIGRRKPAARAVAVRPDASDAKTRVRRPFGPWKPTPTALRNVTYVPSRAEMEGGRDPDLDAPAELPTPAPPARRAERQEWRLDLQLQGKAPGTALDILCEQLRGPREAEGRADGEATIPANVRISYERRRLFAYAPHRRAIRQVRVAIEHLVERNGLEASITVSVWDRALDRWRQIDPHPGATAQLIDDVGKRIATEAAARHETNTLVASVGRLVHGELERSVLAHARALGLDCDVVRRPRVLTTRLEFIVTGSQARISDFRKRLINECNALTARQRSGLGDPRVGG
jgi:hypothetical protein